MVTVAHPIPHMPNGISIGLAVLLQYIRVTKDRQTDRQTDRPTMNIAKYRSHLYDTHIRCGVKSAATYGVHLNTCRVSHQWLVSLNCSSPATAIMQRSLTGRRSRTAGRDAVHDWPGLHASRVLNESFASVFDKWRRRAEGEMGRARGRPRCSVRHGDSL